MFESKIFVFWFEFYFYVMKIDYKKKEMLICMYTIIINYIVRPLWFVDRCLKEYGV